MTIDLTTLAVTGHTTLAMSAELADDSGAQHVGVTLATRTTTR